jgi:hypothetical protein
MAFGDRLLQLAQGIIANERQRKQLELRREQLDSERKQAEQTLAMQTRTVEAKEKFNEIQAAFQQLKLQEAQDPEKKEREARKQEAEIKLIEEEAAKWKADRLSVDKSPTKTTEIFKQDAIIKRNVKESRSKMVLDAIRKTPVGERKGMQIPGVLPVDPSVISGGLEASNRITLEGMEERGRELNKRRMNLLRQVELGFENLPEDIQNQIRDLEKAEDAITAATTELSKVEAATITETEYIQSAAAVSAWDRDQAGRVFNELQQGAAIREQIFGAVPMSRLELLVGLKDARAGDPETITTLIRRSNSGFLNERGTLADPEGGADLIKKWLYTEGVTDLSVWNSVINTITP